MTEMILFPVSFISESWSTEIVVFGPISKPNTSTSVGKLLLIKENRVSS